MNKIGFYFLSSLLIITAVFAGFDSVDPTYQLIGSLFFIVFLGIPHGAIDHIIFLEDNSLFKKPHFFYLMYFGLMGVYLICWLALPLLSFIFFILLSAYHFGQSQFSEISKVKKPLKFFLNFFWGCSILAGLIYYNIEDIILFSSFSSDMAYLSAVFDREIIEILLPISTIVTFIILVVILAKKQIGPERFFFELYLLILIHICFFILPFFVGFTIYFVVLHSFKVLKEEFSFLKSRRKDFEMWTFIKLLLPYTLMSIIGGGVIVICAHYQIIGISNVLLGFVFISILTLPHSFVMNNFYQKFMKPVV